MGFPFVSSQSLCVYADRHICGSMTHEFLGRFHGCARGYPRRSDGAFVSRASIHNFPTPPVLTNRKSGQSAQPKWRHRMALRHKQISRPKTHPLRLGHRNRNRWLLPVGERPPSANCIFIPGAISELFRDVGCSRGAEFFWNAPANKLDSKHLCSSKTRVQNAHDRLVRSLPFATSLPSCLANPL